MSQSRALPVYFIGIKPLVCHSPGPYLYTLLVSNLWCVTVQGPTCILYWYQTSGVSQSRTLPVYFIGIKPLVCHSPGPYLYTLLVSNLWCVTVQDPTCILYWYQTSGVSQSRALPVYFIGIKPLVCHSPGPYLYTLLVSNLWCVTVQGPTCILYWYQTSGVSQSRTLPVYFIGIKPLVCHSPGPYLYTLLVSNLWCVTVQGPTCILYWYQTSGVSQSRTLPVYFIGIKPLVCHSPGPYLYTLLVSNLWCVTVQGPTCILYWSLNLWCVTVQGPTCILYWYQTSGVSQSRALPVYFIGH